MRRIFADRAAYLADPDYSDVPVAGLTAPCYAKERAATIDPAKATPSASVKAGGPNACGNKSSNFAAPQTIVTLGEGPHTTHFPSSMRQESGRQYLYAERQLRFSRNVCRRIFVE